MTRQVGRKPKPASQRQNYVIALRTTLVEARLLRAAAQLERLPVATYVRLSMLKLATRRIEQSAIKPRRSKAEPHGF